MFYDTQGLASINNVTFSLGDVRKESEIKAVVSPDFPWETSLHFYTSAIAIPANTIPTIDFDTYRIYYSCFFGDSPMYLCLAVSSDYGKTWNKPLTMSFPFNGNLPTNRVFVVNLTSPGSWPGSVLLDSRSDVPASERFKISYEDGGGLRYIYIATSPDGINWSRRNPEEPLFPVRLFSDTQTAIIFDPLFNRYLVYGRQDSNLPGNTTSGCFGGYASLRRVMLAISNDSAVGTYAEPFEILQPGYPDDINCLDIYNPAPIVVSGAILLLPSSYRHFSAIDSIPSPQESNVTANDGILDIRLAISRNGINYSFISRDVFLTRGVGYRDPIHGSFSALDSDRDAGFVFATAGGLLDNEVFIPVNSRLPSPPFPYHVPSSYVSLLYWAAQRTHGGSASNSSFEGILRATLRREGFACLRTPSSDPVGLASFTTIPLAVPKTKDVCGSSNSQLWLLVNAKTSVAGKVSVTFLTPSTLSPLLGFDIPIPFTGDSVRAPVKWATVNNPTHPYISDISTLGGSDIVIKVDLVHAQLFSWEVQCI